MLKSDGDSENPEKSRTNSKSIFMLKTISKKKMIAFMVFAIAILTIPTISAMTAGNSEITQIALNYGGGDPTGNSILNVMEFGLAAATTFGLLCGIQAVALGVPLL